ncbi:MAG: VWA domain-containing protein [Myxococcota bacterium]
MLEWATPLWLAALPLALLPWVAWWRPHALTFSSLGAVKGGRSLRRLADGVVPLFESLALALVVLALARPQEVQRETQRESQGIDILLAIDTSGSMETPDMGSAGGRDLTRLEAAKLVAAKFVEGRPDDRVGLVVFGEEAFVQVPLTLDHVGLTDLVSQIDIGMAGKNATAVGTAVAVAAKHMKELPAPSRVVILVTDGRSNAGVSPTEAAEAAAALKVRVYTIGVGSAGGSGLFGMLRGGAEIDEPMMQAVAATTGGKYFRASDARALLGVYEEIDRLEKTTARTKEFVHRDERYLVALLPAIALYVTQLVLASTVLRRIP